MCVRIGGCVCACVCVCVCVCEDRRVCVCVCEVNVWCGLKVWASPSQKHQ